MNIPDIGAPLVSLPDTTTVDWEEFIIEDEDMPLGNLPKTGSTASAGMGTLGLLTAIASIAGAGATLKKKDEE
jgi:LPXTG-motif cell wall-anchored protein